MRRVLLILPSASYRARALTEAAKHLGIELVTASEHPQALASAFPDRFLELDLTNPWSAAERIATFARTTRLDAVVALDDGALACAAAAAARLGLTHNPHQAIAATRDKALMRRLLDRSQVPQPSFALAGGLRPSESRLREERPGSASAAQLSCDDVVEAAESLGYPVVVKPCTLSGSRGVIRADDAEGARRAARRARAILAGAGGSPAGPLLVERFVPGAEIALDGLLTPSGLEVIAIFDKPDPLDGPFFEETIYVTPSRLPQRIQAAARATTAAACSAIGLIAGPVHAELRVPSARRSSEPGLLVDPLPGDPTVVVLEVAARPIGGRCGEVLRLAGGTRLEEAILGAALGDHVAVALESGAFGAMMIPIPASGRLERVEGLDEAARTANIVHVEVSVPIGRAISALPEGDCYLGFLLARAERADEAEAALRAAHERLAFTISTSLQQAAS